jgi:hypothetical protein
MNSSLLLICTLLTVLVQLVSASTSPLHRLRSQQRNENEIEAVSTIRDYPQASYHHHHNLAYNIRADLPEWAMIVVIVVPIVVGLLLLWWIIRICMYDTATIDTMYAQKTAIERPAPVPVMQQPAVMQPAIATPTVTSRTVAY